jgi:hypothetical protein
MKRITALPYVLVLTTVMSILSCQKETDHKQDITTKSPDGTIELNDYEIASIAYANPKELSPAEVLNIVRNFEDSVSKAPETKGTTKSTFEIIGKSYVDEKGRVSEVSTKGTSETKVPVFNITVKKGKQRHVAVVSGDERVPLVIAYRPDVKEEEDPMLLISRLSLVDKVKEVERIVDSLYAPTISKLELKFGKLPEGDVYDYVKNNITSKNGIPRSKSVVKQYVTNIISQVGPLSVTEWDQHYPYNGRMDIGTNCSDATSPYPAGCFVIAAAQIQAYYRPSLQIDVNGALTPLQWDPILEDPWGGNYFMNVNTYNHLTGFIRKVFDGCATTPSCDGSSTASASGVNYLRQTLNVNNGISLNMTDIKGSLDQLKLVLATGYREPNNDGDPKVGHAWVIDGYAVTRLNPGESIVGNTVWQRYNMYLHCNLGWGGIGSGYYLVGKDNIGSLTFQPNLAQEYKINLTFFSNISKK